MNTSKDNTPKFRMLRVLRMIIERPKSYTAKALAERCEVQIKAIYGYIDELKNAGFEVDYDDNYRYFIENENQFEHLKDILFFTEKDQNFILDALSKTAADERYKSRIQKKMENIYDFTRLGSNLISGQFMTKINLLEKAKKEEKVVILQDYHSTNSGKIEDKTVEPFHILPNEDILHALDIKEKTVKHYRISRIKGVELLDAPWNYVTRHVIYPTDPFRISNPKQVRVKIKVKTGGYNELIERFPATYGFLQPTVENKEIYLLDCMVNQSFRGIMNFIMGNFHHVVEILEPESLIEAIKEEVEKIKF
jgi:predicted DNA-binding transcriptional regulator YafY